MMKVNILAKFCITVRNTKHVQNSKGSVIRTLERKDGLLRSRYSFILHCRRLRLRCVGFEF